MTVTKTKIVTREWLRDKVWTLPEWHDVGGLTPGALVVVGRALAALYHRQTADEQATATTDIRNGIGFAGPDAKLGTKCALYFLTFGTLQTWMINVWTKPNAQGFPRICKYARQLNEIAITRQVHEVH